MSKTNIVITAVAWFLVCGVCVDLSAQSRQNGRHAARILLHGKARTVVEGAVDGALGRLASETCQRVLQDFRDGSNQTLEARLKVLDQTAGEYVASLYFADGDDSTQCRLNDATVAFTEPGSRVIHICARRFTEELTHRPDRGEILIIHEVLHSLGLGENPPTATHITAQVWFRCNAQSQ
jgi:hypothetical protein